MVPTTAGWRRIAWLGLFGVGLVCLLGEQGTRIGPWLVPSWPWLWNAWGALAVFWLLGQSRLDSRRQPGWVVLLCLASFFVTRELDLQQSDEKHFVLRVSSHRTPPSSYTMASSVLFNDRKTLNRLTGVRRRVDLESTLWLHPPHAGDYRLSIDCDDDCEWAIGGQESSLEPRWVLGPGEHKITLGRKPTRVRVRYSQRAGPAFHRAAWDGPAWVEPFPLASYMSDTRQRPHRLGSAIRFLVCLASWGLGVASLLFTLRRAPQLLAKWSLPAAFVIVFAVAALFRITALEVHAGRVADSRVGLLTQRSLSWLPAMVPASEDPYRADVRSYLDRASKLSSEGFYAPSFREPFYVLLVAGFVATWGEYGVLIQSTVFSIATLFLFAAIAGRQYSARWALALTLPVAVHEWLIREAPTGYRLGAYGFGTLCVVGVMFVWTSERRFRGLLDGLVAGGLCLVRLSAVSLIAPLLMLRLSQAQGQRRWHYGLGFVVAWLGLVGPFLWSNAAQHGDPFYSISFHTEFWMRAEGLGTQDGPVSLPRYILGEERLAEFLKGTFYGLTSLPIRTFWGGLARFPILNALVIVLGMIGLVAALWKAVFNNDRRCMFVPLAYWGHLIPFAYIQNFASGEMPRFVMPAYFMLILAIPIGVRTLATKSARRH